MPELGIGLGITKGAAPKTKLLLDKYDIDAAFSLRKVRADYNGPCVRVRNSSGDFADIGFTSKGVLDEAALNDHCGDNDGTVQTWYNQSTEGGRYNAVQDTVDDQPIIYDASAGGYLGYIDTDATGGTNDAFTLENETPACPSILAVYQQTADSGTHNYLVSGSGQGITLRDTYNETGVTWYESDSTPYLAAYNDGVDYTKKYLLAGYAGGSTNFLTLNGYVTASDTDASVDGILVNRIAGRGDADRFQGKIWEVFLSTSDLSDKRIALENSILSANELTVPEQTLLEKYDGAAAAYSLRCVNREHVGPIIELRATQTTEVTEDVYLDSTGVINESRITALCTDDEDGDALVDGFVETWYDQAGSNDATQTTDANQPKIHDATDGVVLENGKPAVEFDPDNNTVFNISESFSGNNLFGFSVVNDQTSVDGSVKHVWSNLDAFNDGVEFRVVNSYSQTVLALNNTDTVLTHSSSGQSLNVYGYDGSTVTLAVDGTPTTSSVSETISVSSGSSLGGRISPSIGAVIDGTMQEFVLYTTSQSTNREDIESNINAHYLIYQQAPKSTSTGFYADHQDVGFAVSLRQIHSDALLCMEVTRTSDGQAKNIGFKDGVVDTAAIEEWCGSGDGRVTKLYNQIEDDHHFDSITNRDHLNPRYLNTPKICDAGSVVMHEGHPAMYHDSTWVQGIQTDYRILSASNPYELPNMDRFSYHAVADRLEGNGRFIFGSAGSSGVSVYFSGNSFVVHNTRSGAAHNEEFATTSLSYYNDIQDGVQSGEQRYIGGDTSSIESVALSQTSAQAPDLFRVLRIGSDQIYPTGSNNPFSGHTFEFILMTSAQDDTKLALQNEQINDFYLTTVDNDTTHSTGFLSEFSGAAAAYSVRKLGDGEFCMRVRKTVSSEDYYMNVGFDANGDLDTAAIEEFGGSNDVFVHTWYDQSGNGRHATQDTNADQPKIYDGTDGIFYENDKPSLDFDGSNHYFDLDVFGFDDISTFEVLSTSDAQWIGLNQQGVGYSPAYASSSSSTDVFLEYGTDPSLYVNSSLIATGNDGTTREEAHDASSDGNQKVISIVAGSTANWSDSKWSGFDGWYFDGSLQELIIYDSDQTSNRSDIESNINNYFLTYQEASASPATGLLSEAPNAAAAYSVRQLGDAKLCMKVRRGSDDATKNIGFKKGVVDTAAIEAFCGNSDGTVATWYDQSGSGNHATQGTAGSQPKIYDNATGIVTENGNPSLTPQGFGGLTVASFAGDATTSVFEVINADQSPVISLDDSISTKYAYLGWSGQSGSIGRATNVYVDTISQSWPTRDDVWQAINNAQHLISYQLDTSDYTGLSLRYNLDNTAYAPKQQEVIIYTSDQSSNREDIETNINNHFKVYTPFTTGLLDSYPGAAAAYSLRRLSSAYTGPAIEVTSDGSTQDIGFDAEGNLDTSALAVFCGSNDGTVSKWYDQSGEGNDATQATAADQPKIYDGTDGVVLENGKPAAEFDSSAYLSSTTVTNTGEATAYVVANADDTAVNKVIFFVPEVFAYLTNAEILTLYSGITSVDTNGETTIIETNDTLVKNLIFFGNDGSTTFGGVNGQAFVTEDNVPNSDSGYDKIKIGANATNTINFDGTIQEAVYYNSDQRSVRSGIEKNINKHYSIYDQPLLDVVPDAAAAYSLRKLRADYTGPAISVYNGTDYKDIYFRTNGTLDTGAISKFCGSNDGTVAIWYDQSGSANHAEQTTVASQPKIYDGTDGLVTENGKPAVEFDGTNDTMKSSNFSSQINSPNFLSGVVSFDDTDDQYFVDSDSPGRSATGILNTNFSIRGVDGGDASTGQVLMSTFQDSDTGYLYVNTIESIAHSSSTLLTYTNILIGDDEYFLDGKVQEIILWDSDQSGNRAVAEANINHYYSIY